MKTRPNVLQRLRLAGKVFSSGLPAVRGSSKLATQTKMDAAAKKIGKAENKPSVTAVAREYMGAGWDNASVLKLLKVCKIKHTKDESGMASLRRSLARSGDIDVGGTSKKKVSKKKTASKKKVSKKKVSKKKTASKKKSVKKTEPKKESEDFED